MSAVDFSEWAAPGLDITLGGRTFTVQPPSVDAARKVLAAAVRGEVVLGIARDADGNRTTTVPPEIQAVLDTIGPDEHPALGDTWHEMAAAGIPAATIDRVAYYAVFVWARGRDYADSLATLLWAPRDLDADDSEAGDGEAPKGS